VELTAELAHVRERSDAECARAERAEQSADHARDELDGLRMRLDVALAELSELTRRAAEADGRTHGLQDALEAERRATEREAARADRAEEHTSRAERRAREKTGGAETDDHE
jgi:hypothetical protein